MNRGLWVAFVVLVAAVGGVAGFLKTRKSPEERLAAEVAEASKQCPMKVDDETRLDGISAGPGMRIVYSYTAVTMAKADIADIELFSANIREFLTKTVKTAPELRRNRERGVTFVYAYKDKNGEPLVNIEIGPADYRAE
ncbi:MAG: hypothetical protein ACYTKD_24225 [Planctomycetota bacterium]|jgi:hypothetical protein